MAHTPGELTTTLILALSQSQEQVKILQEHTRRIEQLDKENEKLKKELEDLRKAREEQETFGVDELFQQNAECRAEILRLKQKLRKYKEKAAGRLGVPISSPASAVTTPGSPRQPQRHLEPEISLVDADDPPAKRQRLGKSPQDAPANIANSRDSSTGVSKRNVIEQKVAAISLLAEDGEEHIVETPSIETRRLDREGSLYKRLDGLLSTPGTGKAPLGRTAEPEKSIQLQNAATPGQAPKYNISNIRHVPRESTTNVNLTRSTPSTPLQEVPKTGNKGRSREKLQPRRPARSSKAGVSLRNTPIDQLRLSDFKPNPRWLDSHGVSYDEFLYGNNKARLEELAKTLPTLPGHNVTEDELLTEIMGAGSKNAISKLTPIARKNLLHEARLKRVASAFGKTRTDAGRENDPPGFWDMDMPCTQQEAENKRIASERDKVEVKRRYDDAMSRQGRFIFADENVE